MEISGRTLRCPGRAFVGDNLAYLLGWRYGGRVQDRFVRGPMSPLSSGRNLHTISTSPAPAFRSCLMR